MTSVEGSVCTHRVKGEFRQNGVTYSFLTDTDRLEFVKEHIPLKSDDTVIATYPKSGTTWMKYIVYLMNQDMNQPDDQKQDFFNYLPYLEFTVWYSIEKMMIRPQPRLFVTHLYYRDLKKHVDDTKMRVIFVLRNPKDTLVSYFHFYRMCGIYGGFEGDWNDFFSLILQDRVAMGNVLDFNLEWWEASKRHTDTILPVSFEDMKENLPEVIRKVAKFLGKSIDEEHVDWIAKKTSFTSMKDDSVANFRLWEDVTLMNNSISPFMRKGEVGDWKNHFTVAQNEWMDEQIKSKHKHSDLTYHYK